MSSRTHHTFFRFESSKEETTTRYRLFNFNRGYNNKISSTATSHHQQPAEVDHSHDFVSQLSFKPTKPAVDPTTTPTTTTTQQPLATATETVWPNGLIDSDVALDFGESTEVKATSLNEVIPPPEQQHSLFDTEPPAEASNNRILSTYEKSFRFVNSIKQFKTV